jgi:predicted RecB family nuclease
MQRKLRGEYKRAVDSILRKSINVFSNFHGDVYFPTYSNKLKDIGRYLGFHWADEKASGEQSVVWRKR